MGPEARAGAVGLAVSWGPGPPAGAARAGLAEGVAGAVVEAVASGQGAARVVASPPAAVALAGGGGGRERDVRADPTVRSPRPQGLRPMSISVCSQPFRAPLLQGPNIVLLLFCTPASLWINRSCFPSTHTPTPICASNAAQSLLTLLLLHLVLSKLMSDPDHLSHPLPFFLIFKVISTPKVGCEPTTP